MKGKLFCQVRKGFAFHYGDNPDHVLVKAGDQQSVCTHGFRKVNPHVLVFEEEYRAEERNLWVRPRKQK